MIHALVEFIVSFCVLIGGLFLLSGSLGLLRCRELFDKAQAVTKAGVVGAGIIILAASAQAGSLVVFVQGILILAIIVIAGLVFGPVVAEWMTENSKAEERQSD